MTIAEVLVQRMPRDSVGDKLGRYNSLYYTLVSMATYDFKHSGSNLTLLTKMAQASCKTGNDVATYMRDKLRNTFLG